MNPYLLGCVLAALALLFPDAGLAAPSDPGCDIELPPMDAALGSVTLRDAGARHGLLIGSVGKYYVPWPVATPYRAILGRQFAILTPGNEMKWTYIHPQQGVYAFEAADCLVRFAEAHGMKVRGHTLVPNTQLSSWLLPLKLDREGYIALMRDHIDTVMGHYRNHFPGTVIHWDVVNEAIEFEHCQTQAQCGLRHNYWYDRIGPDYIALAFRFARQADPRAKLYLNEHSLERRGTQGDTRRRDLFNLLDDLKRAGAPVDGVGLQMHVGARGDAVPIRKLAQLLAGIAQQDLDIAMTEVDVSTRGIPPEQMAKALTQQADVFRYALKECLAQPRCKAFVLWGFSDRVHWLEGAQAAPLDANYQPKPAWGGMLEELLGPPAPRSNPEMRPPPTEAPARSQ